MKKSGLLVIIVLLSVLAFGQNEEVKPKKTTIDILYFHRTERCNTCRSIEENTNAVLDQFFANEVINGVISFRSINFENNSDIEIVNKYEANGPSLFLTREKKGKETIKNFTSYAFKNSLHNPSKFKKGLYEKIIELLR